MSLRGMLKVEEQWADKEGVDQGGKNPSLL